MRTQIKNIQIADHELTGASFADELKVWDETKTYQANDIVQWQGKLWRAKKTIVTTSPEGTLTYAPNVSEDWEEVTFKELFKQYVIDASAGDSIQINLSNKNTNNKNFVFVWRKVSPKYDQTNTILSFSNSNSWAYDNTWVTIDGVLRLKRNGISNMNKSGIYFTAAIDTTLYRDINSINTFIG